MTFRRMLTPQLKVKGIFITDLFFGQEIRKSEHADPLIGELSKEIHFDLGSLSGRIHQKSEYVAPPGKDTCVGLFNLTSVLIWRGHSKNRSMLTPSE